jgi:PAS domain S-box-containing protein
VTAILFGLEPQSGAPVAAPEQSPVPVLVVDDNASKRLAVKAVLAPLGYQIVEADSGVAALRCVMDQDFAVILLDVCMPLMDGFETAALLRQRQQSEMTPIIFFTAFGRDDLDGVDRYAEGAVDFILAPVPPDELRAKVSVFANLFIQAKVLAARAREVQASSDLLLLLTDTAPIGIFHVDVEGRYVYTNERWAEITGIASGDAIGRRWDADIDIQRVDRPESTSLDGVPMHPEQGRRYLLRVPGAEPRTLLVNRKAVPQNDGGTAGWVGTLADITAEAGAETAMCEARDKANEATRLKSDFLANMSHEIRTPMNGVIGMTDLLLETNLDDRQRDYAQTVRNSGEALLTIINDILDFSKVEAGKLEIEHVEFSLRAIMEDVVVLLGRSARTKGLNLVTGTDDTVPAHVVGDPGRVRQVLTNLIGNAIKFTRAGEIVVHVSLVGGDGPAVTIRVEVADTGAGIAPDKLALVFQPFVQADMSTSRKHGGTGLGLAISGQLVALMGGDCGVTSELGSGSKFWFTLPLATTQEAGPPVRQQSPPEAAPLSAWDGRSEMGYLLLAEDNLINQKVAVAMLSSAGYRVHTVINGAEAVQAAAERHYDAILMDCHMPELNGYEATAAIRSQEGPSQHTPIIAMTAGARREDRDRCLAEGMDSYLAKPVSKDTLLALVGRTLKDNPPLVVLHPPEGRPSTGEISVDPAFFDELRALGGAQEGFLVQLVDRFVHDTEARLIELRHAVEGGDVIVVARIAHSINGSSGQLGGGRLARACARLEERSEGSSLADADSEMREVELAYEELRLALTVQVSPAEPRSAERVEPGSGR